MINKDLVSKIKDEDKKARTGGRTGFQDLPLDHNYNKDTESFRDLFSYNYIKMLEKYNLSTADISRKLDAYHPTVSRWRRGGLPCEEFIKYLCLLFDCDYIDFFRRE